MRGVIYGVKGVEMGVKSADAVGGMKSATQGTGLKYPLLHGGRGDPGGRARPGVKV